MSVPQILMIILALTLWVILSISFGRDRSRYRNCYFFFFALVATVVAACFAAGENAGVLLIWVAIVTCSVILLVPFFLIHNGIVMIKREGRSLSNMLSFLLGIVILIGEICFAYIVVFGVNGTAFAYEHPLLTTIGLFVSISVIYGSVSFVIFMLYTLFLMLMPRKKNFDYIIIHGAGLLDGDRVSKLLADRIDKAISVYHKDPTPTIMIPSGGKGGDETVSEAEAMAKYLIEKGIPEDRIILEDKSATTYENLQNSKEIIDSREGTKYTALVTSNYHVYRALRYCRKIGLKCTGIGSHVALYYWPSALIREYVAVHREKKHLIGFIVGWLICVLPIFF